ncbi:PVC-type heme-binding CxxCH protein [Aquirufa sp. ROCK-SH2]
MKISKNLRPLGVVFLFAFLSLSIFSFNFLPSNRWANILLDSLTESEKRLPQNALKGLKIFPGLEINSFATEPMLQNPTNMDIDADGRIWIVEAYNYRPNINGNPTTPNGDRILILSDTNGDGKADSQQLFYQSKDLNAPLGIAVLDSMVIVSQSPYIWKMFDDNRDGKADRKEIMFQGIGGEQHDHGAHSFTFGPDGKLYFNFGNEGKQLLDANGKPVLDQDGDPIGPKKYRQGMVFRCDLNGKNVEVLGHNFRNNYEVALDSYGALWQSDNDDDGNKGVRINAVFEHGNYGYTDEMTGEGWSVNRTNIESEIPLRHWHLNDPGVVPNLLQTGSGSPTGILVYEGKLLPAVFQNQLIHSDAGPNVVRSYGISNAGAGFKAQINNIAEGTNDQWFRPADVCAAPDGSLFIADWYDPGVGGHQAGDQVKGRIYRIAPKGHAYQPSKINLSNIDAALQELENPNLSRRYLAFNRLVKGGTEALNKLKSVFYHHANPRIRARAFWLINRMSNNSTIITEASKDSIPEIRMMAIRAAKQLTFGKWKPIARELSKDANPQVRRELAIALRHNSEPEANKIWAELALQHDGQDRWYLEALGIGADDIWDGRINQYLALENVQNSKGFSDIIWRSRSEISLPHLFGFLESDKNLNEKLRYFRALDFVKSDLKNQKLIQLMSGKFKNDLNSQLVTLRHLNASYIQKNKEAKQLVISLLPKTSENEYLELVTKYEIEEEKNHLLQLILQRKQSRKVGQVLYKLKGGAELIQSEFPKQDEKGKSSIIESIRWTGTIPSIQMLFGIMLNQDYSLSIRREAATGIGNSSNGEDFVLKILKEKSVPQNLIPSVVESVSKTWRKAIRLEANTYLGSSNNSQTTKNKHPELNELIKMKGDAKAGVKVFVNQCSMCHQIFNEGIDFGPKLTEIGSKLSREGLYISVFYPNSGIGFGYETFELITKSGETYQGIIVSKTETDIALKIPGGIIQNFKTSALKSIKQLPNSLMPEDLANQMNTKDLTDLIEYLSTLKKK